MSWEPVVKALQAAVFVLCHTGIVSVILVGFYGVERLIHFLWGSENPMLFGSWPLAYVFHAVDLGLVLIFGYRAILAANTAFEG